MSVTSPLATCLAWPPSRAAYADGRTRSALASTSLAPVLDEFVAAKGGKPDLAFWDRVCDRSGGGSGPTYLSGWVKDTSE